MTYNTYPGGTDVLGLVASNNVAVCHNTTPCATPNRIDAAILALQHSFYVQSWDSGSPLGTLTINGVIAQEFRGAVGTFNSSQRHRHGIRQGLPLRLAAEVPEPAVLPDAVAVGVAAPLVRGDQADRDSP